METQTKTDGKTSQIKEAMKKAIKMGFGSYYVSHDYTWFDLEEEFENNSFQDLDPKIKADVEKAVEVLNTKRLPSLYKEVQEDDN